MIHAILVDDDGFYIEPVLANEDELTKNHILEIPNLGGIKLRWDGEKWVEGATEEEIEEWKALQETQFLTTEQVLTQIIISSL